MNFGRESVPTDRGQPALGTAVQMFRARSVSDGSCHRSPRLRSGLRTWTQTLATVISPLGVFLFAGSLVVSGGKSLPGQQSDSPPPSAVEKGKEIYGQACVQCHSPRHTMIQRKNAEGWRKTIYRMISRGAHVMPGEVELLTAYLTATYGPGSPPAALGEKTGSSAQPSLPEGRGRETLVGSCVQCHAVQVVLDSRKSQADWKETVARMRSLGANLSDSEEQALVDYLSRHFAPR